MSAIGSSLGGKDVPAKLVFVTFTMAAVTLLVTRRRRSSSKIDKQELIEHRHAAKSQSVSHSHDPLVVMRGDGAYLIDERGRRYLDSRNNVASIGHQHPLWVKAVCSQVALTNTNSRYLHPLRVQLVKRLLQTLPSNLEM